MLRKGWNQSELARRSGLQRNAISTYKRGLNYPTPSSLHSLAKALGMAPDDLLPGYDDVAHVERQTLDIKVSADRPNEAWLKVDRRVSLKTAVAVADILNSDEISD